MTTVRLGRFLLFGESGLETSWVGYTTGRESREPLRSSERLRSASAVGDTGCVVLGWFCYSFIILLSLWLDDER